MLTSDQATYIPYRDSKLTRILQESLGGNSRTTLIINCSPSSYNEAETIGTLRFGMRAKSIKNSARVNAELSPTELKGLLKKAQAVNSTHLTYIAALEAELAIWRSGGNVEQSDWATSGSEKPTTGATPGASTPAKKAPSSRSMTPAIPAIGNLRGDLESRPPTPTAIGLDKDERDEFLKRENELTDQLGERVRNKHCYVLMEKLIFCLSPRNLRSLPRQNYFRRFARNLLSSRNKKLLCLRRIRICPRS